MSSDHDLAAAELKPTAAAGPNAATQPIDSGGESQSLAWLSIRLIGVLRAHHVARLAGFGLSLPEGNVLLHLQPETSMPMSQLADLMGFDKSNLTTVMTKLERRGLVGRDSTLADRRMRAMRLTDEGAKVRHALDAELSRDSPLTRGLDEADRQTLTRILLRLGLPD